MQLASVFAADVATSVAISGHYNLAVRLSLDEARP